ncbi:sensor histidine kinase [Paenibacillus sp. sptzw28]|uniref:sensor histidine kinase n=1 Tax=Paenibacillus sp. sptzw28 TaxID=715179 RepID=UPI00216285FD|nr:sensor histidine kinase [Paenibacillus sp. sptzw28]
MKTKLSFMISFIVFVLLVLNVVLSEYSTRVHLKADVERNMDQISQQVSILVNQNIRESELVQSVLDEKLKLLMPIAADNMRLRIDYVNDEYLAQLVKQMGVLEVDLLIRNGGNYIIRHSSDPSKVGKNIKELGSAGQAMLQELDTRPGSDETSEHVWTGPMIGHIAASGLSVGKWGFYESAADDYIISCFIENTHIGEYGQLSDENSVLSSLIAENPYIFEISGFNPALFGQASIDKIPQLTSAGEMSKYPVVFGSYNYREPGLDEQSVKEASLGNAVFRYTTIQNREIIKSFVPIQTPVPYVVGIVMDSEPLVNLIDEQRNNQISICVVLLIIVVVCSYFMSDILIRPVRSILWKVNEVSFGRFDNSIEVNRKDEFGQLAQRVNAMSKNLGIYMTKLKLAFEENRSMKEHLESFINHTTDAIHVVDLNGCITQVNQAFEQLYGYTSEEALGHSLPLVPEHLNFEEQQTLESLKSGKLLTARETVRVTKGGEWISVSITTSPIRDKHGTIRAFASITRDMTGRNKMEELLRRSEKLTTVGQLAAGVAHEIRNPLTTLRGFLQLQLETNKLNTRHIDIMLSELDRINLIVSEFLILAKPQASRFEEKDVRFILGDVISLLDSQAHLCDVVFETRFSIEPCLISCEENQLKQVFINVLKNAIEAMPSGGRVQIHVDCKGDQHVSVSIIDEGIGIPEDMISKLGDPFFTGKETGTGLGIMVSQRIIQSHQGTMDIKSKVNEGTKVTIRLPLWTDGAGTSSERHQNHVE